MAYGTRTGSPSPSPTTTGSSGCPHSAIIGWLLSYDAAPPGVTSYDNTTVRLDLDNEPQPDGLLPVDEDAGGHSHVSDDSVEGPPELIVEVAHSSAAYDLHDKKRAYRRNGVQEQVVWQIEDEQIDWFILEGGSYLPLSEGEESRIESRVFPGLALDVEALLAERYDTVLAALQEQTGTEAHRAFIGTLPAKNDRT